MAAPGNQRVVIASGQYRACAIGVLVLLALMTLGGLVDPVPSVDGPAWPGLFIMVLLAGMIVRAARLGLVIERDEVTTRGLLVSRRMSTSDVLHIEVVGYSGQLNWYGQSRFLRMLRLDLRDGERDVPMVVALGKGAHPLQQRANAALIEMRTKQE
ncbi:hypothetical protein [Phycicoccus sp.]|uniref:hypothetical protein n=1 Tax=Phycicoccus sp. TaxID=1902410 RepID=UPI002C57BEAD|nr:hypothetical protein [Phycicoccus sp.]HMM96808.1 hypothetical protein [Phycicoccus sp.]